MGKMNLLYDLIGDVAISGLRPAIADFPLPVRSNNIVDSHIG